MDNPLDTLLSEGIIDEVLGRLQSGKEAEVFVVRYGERVVAAKVYKDYARRSFKNRSDYKEGRTVRNSRDQRAMGRRSSFGKETEEDAWKSAEVDAMYRLHAANVRVPAPVLYFEGVLLMELVRDAEGVTARRLIDTTLDVDQANAAYHDMLGQLVRMLSCDLIHGDLSPYNVLWGADGVTIIDFPQIVSAAQNSNSERFFLRDAENILGYFRRIDGRLEARRGDAAEIWRAYLRRELTPDFLPTGKLRFDAPRRPAAGDGRPARNEQQPRNRFEQPQQHGGRPQQQHGGRPQQQHGGRPQQQHGARPQQQHGARPQQQHSGRPQQQHSGRPQQQHGARPQQQHGARPQQQHGGRGGGGPQPQRAAARASSHGSPQRRAMPEVIVRPRIAPGAPTVDRGPNSRASDPSPPSPRSRKSEFEGG